MKTEWPNRNLRSLPSTDGEVPAPAQHRLSPVHIRYLITVVLFIILVVLLVGCSAGAAEPQYFEVPASWFKPRPATNKTSARARPNAAIGAVPKDGTNVSVTTSADTNAASSTINSMDALDEIHKLAIGDRLSFRIIEDEEDPKPILVTDSGDLEFPYLGRFPAANKTCKQLALELKVELEKEYYYQATVIVAVDSMARSRGKVYLVGAVRAPGPEEIPSDEVLTLGKAILRAGGFSDFADKHHVKVTRKGTPGFEDETYVVNVAEVLEKGKSDSDVALESGDLIYVPERAIRF